MNTIKSITEFTIEDGIAVQKKQLEQWKTVLKSEVYEALVKWATKYNDHLALRSGYDVTRGSDLTNFVCNISMGSSPEKIYQTANLLIKEL